MGISQPTQIVYHDSAIPTEIRAQRHWLLWKYGAKRANGKRPKIPYQTNGKRALPNDSQTWTSLDNVLDVMHSQPGKYTGIGFALHDEFVGWDIDNSIHGKTFDERAQRTLAAVNSYAEITPSGHGIRVLVISNKRLESRNQNGYEFYTPAHYFTFTGRRIPGAPLHVLDRTAEIERLYHDVFTAQTSKRAKTNSAPSAAVVPIPTTSAHVDGIPESVLDILRTPRHAPFRSEPEFTAVLIMTAHGFTYEMIWTTFIQTAHSSSKFQEKFRANPTTAHKWLWKAYQKTQQYIAQNPHVQRAWHVRQWAERQAWTGRTGETQRNVLIAHTKTAAAVGKQEYTLSERQAVELSGVSKRASIRRAQDELVRHGILERVSRKLQQDGTTWRIRANGIHTIAGGGGVSDNAPIHDIFRSANLGRRGMSVWNALERGVCHVQEIAMAVGTSGRTVRNVLQRMARLGLVEIMSDGVVSVVSHDLDTAARTSGMLGRLDSVRAAHKTERAKFRDKCPAPCPAKRPTAARAIGVTAGVSDIDVSSAVVSRRRRAPLSERPKQTQQRKRRSKNVATK